MHFTAAYLESLDGVEITNIPYRGAGPEIAEVIGGQVPYILSTLTGLLPHIKAGKLKAIALTSAERSTLLPNVPTIAESGFPDNPVSVWYGMAGRDKLPDDIAEKISATLNSGLNTGA